MGFITWIIDKLIESEKLKLASKKDKSGIISELKRALKQTERHIETNRNKETDEDIYSDDLVVAWSKVAELVRPYDSDLARLFDSKSEYWYNPKKYKEEIREGKRSFDYRFRLTEVKKIETALNQAGFG